MDGNHPTDGSACAEFFRGYRGCATCIARGHYEGRHNECDPESCYAAKHGQSPYDGRLRYRYEVLVIDQDGRVLARDYDFVIVNGSSAASAASGVASNGRSRWDKDESVTAFYVAAAAKDDVNQFAVCGYERSDEAPGNSGWIVKAGSGKIHEVISALS